MKRIILLVLILHFYVSAYSKTEELRTIQELIEYIQIEPVLPLIREKVHLPEMVMEIYVRGEFNKLWQNKKYSQKMINILYDSRKYGLLPQDYHAEILETLLRAKQKHVGAYFDILLTDGLLLYSHHILNGKLDPSKLAYAWNYPKRENYLDSIDFYRQNIKNQNVEDYIESHHPPFPIYKTMVKEREKWVNLKNVLEGQEPIVSVKSLKPGDSSLVFKQILERLKMLDYIPASIESGSYYDSSYVNYINDFQYIHALEEDGIIGKSTLDALNMSIDEKINIIDINLERIRWLTGGVDDDLIFVNIAGFYLNIFMNGAHVWRTSVMTGAIDTQTPIFISKMKYIVFNPTWTVPRSIIVKSMFERMKGDPNYLKSRNFYLVNRSGDVVDEASLDWANLTIDQFNYSVVQKPGNGNSLGRVKFMFPNEYAIYLHDTPSKTLFARNSRAFSHGCIRVQYPLYLAELLIDDNEKYSEETILDIIEKGDTKNVFLKDPISVMLAYFTADIDLEQRVIYHHDIYSRDAAAIKALKNPL